MADDFKLITLTDFLTSTQIERCIELKTAKPICEEIIKPNIAEINKKLGQENDPMYLSYVAEHVIERAGKDWATPASKHGTRNHN